MTKGKGFCVRNGGQSPAESDREAGGETHLQRVVSSCRTVEFFLSFTFKRLGHSGLAQLIQNGHRNTTLLQLLEDRLMERCNQVSSTCSCLRATCEQHVQMVTGAKKHWATIAPFIQILWTLWAQGGASPFDFLTRRNCRSSGSAFNTTSSSSSSRQGLCPPDTG